MGWRPRQLLVGVVGFKPSSHTSKPCWLPSGQSALLLLLLLLHATATSGAIPVLPVRLMTAASGCGSHTVLPITALLLLVADAAAAAASTAVPELLLLLQC